MQLFWLATLKYLYCCSTQHNLDKTFVWYAEIYACAAPTQASIYRNPIPSSFTSKLLKNLYMRNSFL